MENYSDLSLDDLIFEVKRLKQRTQVLEDDNRILQTELDIAQHGNIKNTPNSGNDDVDKLKEEISRLRSMTTMFTQKYRVVQTFLLLERKALHDVRQELHTSLDLAQKDMEQKMMQFVKSVQHREYGLQKKLQGLTLDLLREKENNNSISVELSASVKKNTLLTESLEQSKKEFDSERNSMKEHFDRINGKIDKYVQQHAEEVAGLQEEIRSKDKAQIELETRSAQLEKQVEINTTAMSRLREGYVKQIDQLERQCEEHVIALNSCRQGNSDLENRLAAAAKENADLQNKISTLREQQEKLLQSHDDVSSDLRAVLAREESLRMELHGTSSDRGDMQRRLKSITDKVRDMELSHKEEISSANRKIQEANGSIAQLMKGLAQEKQQALAAKEEATSAQNTIKARDGTIREQAEEIDKLKLQLEKWRVKTEALEKEAKSCQGDLRSLRSDRDEVLQRVSDLGKEVDSLQDERAAKEQEIEDLRAKLALTEVAYEVDKKREQALAEKTRQLDETKEEIAGLKETIRRECEERTEMMLEISELRDQIKRLSSLNLRSQSSNSGGVDSGQQAGSGGMGRRDDSRTAASAAVDNKRGESMLSQLAASNGAMSDAAWSQRLAKQGSMGINSKGKRKSQYR